MDKEAAVMRLQMDETLAGLTGKLGHLEHQVSSTVRTVKDSVNTVRDTFDLKLQVRQRPWALLASAAAVGFLGGYHSSVRDSGRPARGGKGASAPMPLAHADESYSPAPKAGGNGSKAAQPPAVPAPSWLANLGDSFKPELAELKGIVIGALFGLVREIVTNQPPKPVEQPRANASRGDNGKSGSLVRSGSPLNEAGDE
ncbi:MAG: hypothetical protein WC655_22425 [Candidatus Hydrogenedentales bacterium]|jgi:hypothetical protein